MRSPLRSHVADLHLDIVGGGGWWQDRLVEHAEQLGISLDAVTSPRHADEATKHAVVQRSWHLLPSRKEGWGWR